MRKLFLLLFIVPMLFQGQVVAQTTGDCSRTDYQALIDIYYATEGWNWTNTWDFSQTVDNWYGVVVTDGCVTGLTLSNNNLRGSIPESISNLGALRQLDLSANQLSGVIPTSLGDLSDLRVLALYQNEFYGNIPESIGGLPFLLSLNLQYNQLSGAIPESLGNLGSLHTLSLENNYLEEAIPASLGSLNNIVFLDLGHNRLSGAIPASFSELTTLVNLELNNNYLSDCLPDVSGYGKIETLDLSNNQLYCPFPTQVLTLSSLRWLYLNNNYFYGSLQDNFDSLANLSILHLNNNLLSRALPSSLGQLSLLEELYFQNNYFSDCFPNTYQNLCSIDANFYDNLYLPNNGDFASFCAMGMGSCDPIDEPMDSTGPAGPAGAGAGAEGSNEEEEEEKVTTCIAFEVEGTVDGCTSNRTMSFNITTGEPTFTVMLEGPVSGIATTNNFQFGISNLPYGVYKVTVTDRNGCEASQEITISNDCVTGRTIASSRSNYPELTISEVDWTTSTLQVGESFPNPFPASTNIPIFLSQQGEYHIQVFSATGQEVYQQKQLVEAGSHLITLDKAIFTEAGMYIYQIQLGEQVKKGKLLRM